MTATLPTRGPSTPVGGPFADSRDCALYRFWVRHPVTGLRALGYIGETARAPFVRLMEHIQEKPWADTIIGWEVDDRTFTGKEAVLAAERAAIHAEKPLYNIEENLGNRGRIPPWTAKEQRAARDADRRASRAAVVVGPTLPAGTSAWSRFWRTWLGRWLLGRLAAAGGAIASRLRRAGRWLLAQFVAAVKVAAIWACLAAVAWVGVAVVAAKLGIPVSGRDAGQAGAFLAAAAMGLWRMNRRPRRSNGRSRGGSIRPTRPRRR